jgi:hypothetical protein
MGGWIVPLALSDIVTFGCFNVPTIAVVATGESAATGWLNPPERDTQMA